MAEPQREPDFLKIDQPGGRDHHHAISVVTEYDDGLSDLPCGQVLRRSDLAGREGGGMNGVRIRGVIRLEEIAQFFQEWHSHLR